MLRVNLDDQQTCFNMAQYYVTGVWKDNQGEITHVLLHSLTGNDLNSGEKITGSDAIALIKSGHTLHTLRWNYATATWTPGSRIVVVKLLEEFLKTIPGTPLYEQIESMIRMEVMN